MLCSFRLGFVLFLIPRGKNMLSNRNVLIYHFLGSLPIKSIKSIALVRENERWFIFPIPQFPGYALPSAEGVIS